MTRTVKVLEVLGLFDEQRSSVRATSISRLLRVSQATAYRCIGDLEGAGLLESAGGGNYVLGPAIVELDRRIRLNDPLIIAAAEVCRGLSDRTRGTVLLCRRHGLKVLCVHEAAGSAAPRATGYERGRAMPLYRGATSQAILAYVSDAVLRHLLINDGKGLQAAGWPTEAAPLRARLARMREQRVFATAGEVSPDAMGWAVPLFQGKHLLGSLSVVRRKGTVAEEAPRIIDQLRRGALRIEGRIEDGVGRR